ELSDCVLTTHKPFRNQSDDESGGSNRRCKRDTFFPPRSDHFCGGSFSSSGSLIVRASFPLWIEVSSPLRARLWRFRPNQQALAGAGKEAARAPHIFYLRVTQAGRLR